MSNTKNNTFHLVHVSTAVSKLGPSIPTVNLPAGITCRPDAPCRKDCYATRGNFVYPNVTKSLQNNLAAFNENPKLFFDMIAEVFDKYKYARFHSSGDIVNEEYLRGMCRVARRCKETKILCFTKKYELVNEYVKNKHIIPKNLIIIFSCWDGFNPDNPYGFPTSHVWFPKEKIKNLYIPEEASLCPGKCYECKMCWNLKKGQSVKFKKH